MRAHPMPVVCECFSPRKTIELPVETVDLARGESHTPSFLAKNPMGQVPLLEFDDGTYLAESVARWPLSPTWSALEHRRASRFSIRRSRVMPIRSTQLASGYAPGGRPRSSLGP